VKAKEFEDICLYRMRQEEEAGRATMGRYGVQGSFMKGRPMPDLNAYGERIRTGENLWAVLKELKDAAALSMDHWQPMESLPDFEGVIGSNGRQFVFDAKVCNAASFPLDKESKSQSRQLAHMLKRSKFGVTCFYLIHFPERVLATRTDPEVTYAFPIHAKHPFWQGFLRNENKRITREDCAEYAVPVEWNVLPGGNKPRPDIVLAVLLLQRMP